MGRMTRGPVTSRIPRTFSRGQAILVGLTSAGIRATVRQRKRSLRIWIKEGAVCEDASGRRALLSHFAGLLGYRDNRTTDDVSATDEPIGKE
jgi:hypothetical protein